MGKQFWTILLVVVLAGVAVIIYLTATSGPALLVGELADPVTAADWIKGDPAAPAVLVEYGDFQCPACSAYAPWVWQLSQDFASTSLAVVMRHFPLNQHQNAVPAALAAEAAGQQGRFWEMAERLYASQEEWALLRQPKAKFRDYAAALQLDLVRFDRDYDNPELASKISVQQASGVRSRINSTPTFFLNGRTLENPRSYDEFKQLIQAAAVTNGTSVN